MSIPANLGAYEVPSRVVFLNEFRWAHLQFWKDNHPQYPGFPLSLPPLVKRIYRVGHGYGAPKDKAPPLAGGNTKLTIASEIAGLRS